MSHMNYIFRVSQQQTILGYMNIQEFSTTFRSTYRIWSDFLQDGLWNSGLCSGKESQFCSQVQSAVLCFAGSVLCNWETQHGLLILQLWQPEMSHLYLLASATRSPVRASRVQCCKATSNPSAIPLKPVWDPGVERGCWKCPSSFPSRAIFCCLPSKDQPLQPSFSLPCLPPSAPLWFLSARHVGDREQLKFYKEQVEMTRHRWISQCTQVPTLLWLCSCWQKPPAMTHPSFRAWPWGREQICPAWSNSLHSTKGRNTIFPLYQNSQAKGKAI